MKKLFVILALISIGSHANASIYGNDVIKAQGEPRQFAAALAKSLCQRNGSDSTHTVHSTTSKNEKTGASEHVDYFLVTCQKNGMATGDAAMRVSGDSVDYNFRLN